MWIKLFLRGVGVLAVAFVLTSAVMYWLPVLERSIGWITVSYDNIFVPNKRYRPLSGNEITDAFSNAKKLSEISPVEERAFLDEISDELKKKTNAELYQMKAYGDVCKNEAVDCLGLASVKVKPFIDAILSDRQTAETALYYRAANFISAGSLFVSFVALIFAGLSFRRKRAAKPAS